MNTTALSNPSVTIVNGKAATTSKAVAEFFGKLHKNVIRAIESLKEDLSAEWYRLNFEPVIVEYKNGKGGTQEAPAYNMTRDGFTLLAMGFTGKAALQFKLAYIEAFNAMEAQLSAPRLTNRRWLVSIDHNGQEQFTPVPNNACVLSQEDMLKALVEPNGLFVSTAMLHEFAVATAKRLGERCAYYEVKCMPMTSHTGAMA